MSFASPIELVQPPLPRRRMTIDGFLALAEEGVERMLIDGALWELGMTLRSRVPGEVTSSISTCRNIWNRTQPRPRGEVSVGEVGFRLPGEEEEGDSALGPEIGFASADLVAQTSKMVRFYPGPPVLAVEALPLSDAQDSIIAKIARSLQAETHRLTRNARLGRPPVDSFAPHRSNAARIDPTPPLVRGRVALRGRRDGG